MRLRIFNEILASVVVVAGFTISCVDSGQDELTVTLAATPTSVVQTDSVTFVAHSVAAAGATPLGWSWATSVAGATDPWTKACVGADTVCRTRIHGSGNMHFRFRTSKGVVDSALASVNAAVPPDVGDEPGDADPAEVAARTPTARLAGAEGLGMTLIPGPVEFRMGSPPGEVGRNPASDSPDEAQHIAYIPRSFAISTHEVTVAQFRRFLDANPDVKRRHAYADDPGRMAEVMQQFSPDSAGPQIAVTWYEAAMFCNWLSQREGIPQSEWVYPSSMDEIRHGMRLRPDYLRRTGYRLPTEAEWEAAARARTTTAHFFGESDSTLGEYAWYSRNPPTRKNDPVDPNDPQRTSPVGRLKANQFGLFDIYGNVWEWTQSRVLPYPAGDIHLDVEDDVLVVSDSVARVRRGGAFPYEAAMQRSAARGTVTAFPFQRRDNVGFRVARTVR